MFLQRELFTDVWSWKFAFFVSSNSYMQTYFSKVQLFTPASSRWWKRSSMAVIPTVVDANSFLVVYFYVFTLRARLPLFFFTLMLLCMIEFRLHKNYIWCFSLSYLIELVSLWRQRQLLSFSGRMQLYSFPSHMNHSSYSHFSHLRLIPSPGKGGQHNTWPD